MKVLLKIFLLQLLEPFLSFEKKFFVIGDEHERMFASEHVIVVIVL
jgi:hypothetical protein